MGSGFWTLASLAIGAGLYNLLQLGSQSLQNIPQLRRIGQYMAL
jgi:hypothetical protein